MSFQKIAPMPDNSTSGPLIKEQSLKQDNIVSESETLSFPSVCPICLDDLAQSKLTRVSETCKHVFCTICLQEYLKHQISNFKVAKISCPQDGCQSIMAGKQIKKLLDEKDYKAYETLVLKKIAFSNPKHRLCPVPGCINMVPYCSKSLKAKCKCGAVICNLCGKLCHEGKTCLENIDMEFQLYSSEHEVRFCAVCKTTIKKTEGCKHMTCPICDYEWCWECGRQYSSYHEASCPRTWDPYPPVKSILSWEDLWATSSMPMKIMIILFLIPVLPAILVGSIFLWPAFKFSYTDGDKFYLVPLREKWQQSYLVTKVLLIMLGVILAPFYFVIIVLLWSFYGYSHDEALLRNFPWKDKLADSSLYTVAFFAICFAMIFPLIVVGLYIFWPLYEFSWASEISIRKIFKSVAILVGSCLIGILCLPITMLCILGLPVLYSTFYGISFLSSSIKRIFRRGRSAPEDPDHFAEHRDNKRWVRANPSEFRFDARRYQMELPRVIMGIAIPQNIPRNNIIPVNDLEQGTGEMSTEIRA